MIETPEPPHHHVHTGSPWFDRLLGLTLLIISAASLWSAHETGETMKSLVRENARLVSAQSTPLLQFGNSVSDAGSAGSREIALVVDNYGTGPANIVWFELALGKRRFRDNSDFSVSLAGQRIRPSVASTIAPALLKAGERRAISGWEVRPKARSAQATFFSNFDRIREQLVASACYCSLLQECWITTLGRRIVKPQPVAACSSEGHVSYQG